MSESRWSRWRRKKAGASRWKRWRREKGEALPSDLNLDQMHPDCRYQLLASCSGEELVDLILRRKVWACETWQTISYALLARVYPELLAELPAERSILDEKR
jgi:hypothetical protein